jgi:Family of unknown function (DUF5686)
LILIKKIVVFYLLLLSSIVFSQKTMQGQVVDFDSTIPIAFAKISYNDKIITTNWEGFFTVEILPDNKPLKVSYKGYLDKSYFLSKDVSFLMIKIVSDENRKRRIIYTENKVNAIIKKAVDSKPKTQPEKAFRNFQYKNYEHILVSANPKAIDPKIDTIRRKNFFGRNIIKIDSSNYKFKKLIEKQHLYQTEKVNLIQHNFEGTKETILASRMAGFKEPLYDYLGLNLVSYSLYENQIDILEIPIQNPLSNLGRRMYNFNIIDTLKIQNREVFRIYFQPNRLNSNSLRGLLYVDSETFGLAKAFFRIYGMVNINATYTFNYLKENKVWFPDKRKINVVKGNNSEDLNLFGGTIKFNSTFDKSINNNASDQVYLKLESSTYDVEIDKPVNFKDPGIKIDVPSNSLSKPDSYWKTFKKDSVDVRKIKTYSVLDSLSSARNFEKKVFLGKKIINGYLPVSYVDIDLRSIVKYNNFEGFRLGFGGVTNSKLSKEYKFGAFAAYGFKDERIKFGLSPSYLLEEKTNTWVSASYDDDLVEIGQVQFATQNRRFKIYDPRPINISTFYSNKMFSAFIESKYFAKTDTYFGISRSQIKPLFDYTYTIGDNSYQKYNVTSAQFSVQWTPFSSYMQTPSGRLEIDKRFPKFTFQVTQTIPSFLGNDFNFSKFDFTISHEIPYLSGQMSSVLFQAGLGYGDIPLTHLYSIAPNNLDKDGLLKRITFAGKNSFETMYYNEFFSSRYFSLQARHTFNKVHLADNINPLLAVVTRFAYGNVDRLEQHKGFEFKTLDKGYIESGVELNKIVYGFGLTFFYRYGPNGLPTFEDNLSLKVNFNLDLGF